MEAKAKLRKWGSSLGVVVPSELVKEENLKEGEEIVIQVKKKNPLEGVFGLLKDWDVDTQEMKDEMKNEWERDITF